MIENNDVGLLNESEMMNRSEESSPYEMGASDDFRVEDILDAANLCGNPETTLDEIVLMLDHSDSGARYWAVLALYATGEIGEQVTTKLKELLKDDSPTVAIAAAELLCHMGMVDEALPLLGESLQKAREPDSGAAGSHQHKKPG